MTRAHSLLKLIILSGALVLTHSVHAANDPMTQLVNRFCIDCHGRDDPQGDVRLDQLNAPFFADTKRLELLVDVLTQLQMPPLDQNQPSIELRDGAVAYLKGKLSEHPADRGKLKRLTREEYTNTINDLFDMHFDLSELLPSDPPGEGFNKWGDNQRMSPYQVESYLRTARFVADRLILDERPKQRVWEFGLEQFSGSGRGEFKTDDEFVLTTHYPWRSNLHFYTTANRQQLFRIPEFGRYRMEAQVAVRHSNKAQTISVSVGDPRYPTNFKKIARKIVPATGGTVTVDVTLTAGTYVSYTYESATTWNVGTQPERYTGPQVGFSKVRITGPTTDPWPTTAEHRIFNAGRFTAFEADNAREFTEHVIDLMLNRSLPEPDVAALAQLVALKREQTGRPKAAARMLLTALLSSPHFVYKHEADALDEISVARRLAYFLWNSVPDAALLKQAHAGNLTHPKTLADQVDRMLDDPRSDRFCADFIRQWLQTDKIDDFGPDDRLHDPKTLSFMTIRELAKEPVAFFKEILQHDLSLINLIDSDFLMVNDETAEFYGLADVTGREFRRVPIPADSERGGLVGQAGLLKLTSSKFATSPIRRGAWILQNIYGQRLDPPPGAAFDEPDIRGAETVKQVIEKHKHIETCNRCHARIDPLGMALEHYDEMGRWRDEYRHAESTSLENNNDSMTWRTAPIDSLAVLPDGRTISSLSELKAVLIEDRTPILRSILSKLASYALGRKLSVHDDAMIDEIFDHIAEDDYSLRSAIHAIVGHETFARP